PKEWLFCGYQEIMNPKERYTIIDREKLKDFFRVKSDQRLREEYKLFTNAEQKRKSWIREPDWSNSIAIGSEAFVNEIKLKLGIKAEKRKTDSNESNWVLHEPGVAYN
ncbi:hypothetical protein KJ966_09490, partial [bacterium]|nr:hypothetical protein [bacterium]